MGVKAAIFLAVVTGFAWLLRSMRRASDGGPRPDVHLRDVPQLFELLKQSHEEGTFIVFMFVPWLWCGCGTNSRSRPAERPSESDEMRKSRSEILRTPGFRP